MIIVRVGRSADFKWNHDGEPADSSPLRKCFHRWETAKPRNVREFWLMVTENIYNLFPPKTTSPANFDRCESEAVMVTSPCPGVLPLDWVITVTILPGAKSPLPISKHTEFVNCSTVILTLVKFCKMFSKVGLLTFTKGSIWSFVKHW